MSEDINFFGLTSFRNQKKKFGIRTDDRRRHFYCIGKTGMGKSNLMENMAIQDIQEGRGIAYVDPHGEGAEKLLDFVPANRINDVIYFNPADIDYPIAFNVMEKVDFRYRHLVAGGLMGVFKKVWPDVWSARMEYILNNSILALLEYPDSTLLGVNRMFADPEYREKVVSKIQDPIIKSFWVTEYSRYTQRYEIEATAAIQNKVGQFISNPLIRNIIGQTKSTINMREIMDEKKIFIMDLSKGRIGEDNSRLLGALLITKLQLATMSRVDIPEEDRKDFYLYVDEFQNFATESFANILSEARKYRLNITLGHQYIGQLSLDNSTKMRDAVFGNVGTLAVFRVGAEDAEFLEREFSPEFTAEDLVNLPKYNIYLKLMIDGVAGHPFSAQTLPPPSPLENSNREKIINASRERYGIKREIVDEKISRWSGFEEKIVSDNARTQNEERRGDARQKHEHFGGPAAISPPARNAASIAAAGGKASLGGLYDAVCSICGKNTKVVFQPEKNRPVYCKSCLKKLKSGSGKEASQQPARNVFGIADAGGEKPASGAGFFGREVAKAENIPFHSPRLRPASVGASAGKQGFGGQAKRKEINLADLRKALEESLEKREDPVPEKSPEEELKNRIEEEKKEDKIIEEEKAPEKKEIKPGEKIKF